MTNTFITGEQLSKMSLSEIEELYRQLPVPTSEQKQLALKRMDTGIYDEAGNLIGDKCWEEDIYEEYDTYKNVNKAGRPCSTGNRVV